MFEPFQYDFFIRGLIAATVASGLCGFIGVYVVLRKMSYIGHGLSHAVFGGAVVSFVMDFNFYIGSTVWGFGSALLIILMTRVRKFIAADAAIGIITTSSFALGVALISHYHKFTRNFDAALFGALSEFFGIYIIYYVDIASGASIVLLSAGLFTAALVYSSLRQRLTSMRRIAPTPSAAQTQHALFD